MATIEQALEKVSVLLDRLISTSRSASQPMRSFCATSVLVMPSSLPSLRACVRTVLRRGRVRTICSARARVRALWGLNGWRGNERIADSIKKGPPGARAGGGCCSGSDRAPNFQGSAGRERNPVRGLAQLASLWLIACPAKLVDDDKLCGIVLGTCLGRRDLASRRALPGRKLQFTNPFISSPTTKTP
jgi:hypothetical protein